MRQRRIACVWQCDAGGQGVVAYLVSRDASTTLVLGDRLYLECKDSR